jgi:3-dehydroquinate dehydratase-2
MLSIKKLERPVRAIHGAKRSRCKNRPIFCTQGFPFRKSGFKPARMRKPIYVLNGPNLNLLGTREPEIYGADTLGDVRLSCENRARTLGYEILFHQSNHEGVLIDWVHEARRCGSAVILNAGGLTHTSVSLHDALKTLSIPVIEVHLSNPHKREGFRHFSFISSVSNGVIAGFGMTSYILAVEAAAELCKTQS